MRRFTVAALLAASLAAAALAATAVSHAAESGPQCADLSEMTFTYRDLGGGSYSFAAELLLAGDAAACKQITYTVTIGDVSGTSIILSQKGSKQFGPVTFADTDNQVCVFATTSSAGGHVHDRGPDTGCVPLTAAAVGGRVGVG
jgi:hypothetical protein